MSIFFVSHWSKIPTNHTTWQLLMEREQPLNLIGRRVHQSRLSQKPRLTQTNLASKLQVEGLDIDQTQVSKIENGTRPVTDIEVAIIAKVLNVSSSWLLGETDNPARLK